MNKVLSALQSTSAAGGMICGLSLMEINAILGIILTLTSLILLIVPKIVDLVKKIKESMKDGVIDEDEKKEIIDSGLDIAKDIKTGITEISDKSKDLKK